MLLLTAGGPFRGACTNPPKEQSSCGVSARTLIPQESPPAVKVNKQKLRKSTTNDNSAKIIEKQ